MVRLRALRPLVIGDIAIGKAYQEGRAPEHDGEYVSVIADTSAGEWLAEDNAGLAASSLGDTFAVANLYPEDPAMVAESGRLDAEAYRIAKCYQPSFRPGDILQVSPAMAGALRDLGWAETLPDD